MKYQYRIGFASLVMFLFMDAFFPLRTWMVAYYSGYEADNSLYRYIAVLFYAIAFGIIILNLQHYKFFYKTRKVFFALVVYTLLTIVWSVEKSASIKSIVALLGSIMIALVLVRNLSIKELMISYLIAFFFAGVLSFYFGLFKPDWGVHFLYPHTGLWRGAFVHKNVLARNVSLSVILSIIYLFEYRKNSHLLANLFVVLNLILSVSLLILSGGKSGLLTAVTVSLVFYPFVRSLFKASKNIVVLTNTGYFLGAFLVGGLLYFLINIEEILLSIGGDLTLTGRTLLWAILISYVGNKFLFGYGFDAFWDSSLTENLWLIVGWEPPHAHNAFLDSLLNLGAIGTGLFIICLIQYSSTAIKLIWNRNVVGLIFLSLLVYLLIYNIPGVLTYSQNSVSLLLFIYGFYYYAITHEPEKEENTAD